MLSYITPINVVPDRENKRTFPFDFSGGESIQLILSSTLSEEGLRQNNDTTVRARESLIDRSSQTVTYL